jgi:predicted TIM-barrel fold metal-dependent hydrolase
VIDSHLHLWDPATFPFHAIDVLGSQRCMFASDWPAATLATTNQWWVELVPDQITARRIYRTHGNGSTR